jgi:hypothetical protein
MKSSCVIASAQRLRWRSAAAAGGLLNVHAGDQCSAEEVDVANAVFGENRTVEGAHDLVDLDGDRSVGRVRNSSGSTEGSIAAHRRLQ